MAWPRPRGNYGAEHTLLIAKMSLTHNAAAMVDGPAFATGAQRSIGLKCIVHGHGLRENGC